MTQTIFIGVDGGATKCVVRVEDETGHLLGLATSGPANIRLSPEEAWQSIYTAIHQILQPHAISLETEGYRFHVGMGLAGLEVEEAYQAFLRRAHDFHTLIVATDAHIACLGAHAGQDGAVIIAGTGVVGFQIEQGKIAKVGGFGFPHDDIGGGAWLGLQAVQVTLQWLDGRLPLSGLASAVYAYFDHDMPRFVYWVNQANSTQFATLAPIVVHQCEQGDIMAINLMHQAGAALDSINRALMNKQIYRNMRLPCSLVGGIAPFLTSYVSADLRARLRSGMGTADMGAIFLIRQYLLKTH
jgi:glucosamine kinase